MGTGTAANTNTIGVRHLCVASIGWFILTTLVVLVPNSPAWIAAPIVLIGIFFVVGLLLSVNLNVQTDEFFLYVLYALGLGVAYSLIGGLFINWILPYVGVAQPLAQVPLILFFDISVVTLSVRAYFLKKHAAIPFSGFNANPLSLFLGLVPLVFLFLSIAGAEQLNNGGMGLLTLVMLFGIAIYIVVMTAVRRSVHEWVRVAALFLISLSLLLMYSLRSSHIFGWDINQEYQVFQMTLQHLIWKMSYYPGQAYNACLSITILPTMIAVLTHTASEYVFKVLFQILFAITPVALYLLAKRYTTDTLAFLAAFLFISQTWFYEQMPALIRQEVAFVFYALLLVVLFDTALSNRARCSLFYLFTAGLILSHYSTAYVWIALLFGFGILSYCSRFFKVLPKTRLGTLTPVMCIASLVLLVAWQGPITHTLGHAGDFVSNAGTQSVAVLTPPSGQSADQAAAANDSTSSLETSVGITAVESVTPIAGPTIIAASAVKSGLLTSLFATGDSNTDQNIESAQQDALNRYPGSVEHPTYSDASSTSVMAMPDAAMMPNRFLPFVSYIITSLEWIAKFLFVDIFPLIGLAAFYWNSRRGFSRNDGDIFILAAAAFVLIALMLFVPYIQVYYNLSRLYLQMFLILSTLSIVGGATLVKHVPRHGMLALAIAAAFLFCTLSGAFDQLTGGLARITLDQPPSTLDAPYVYDTEIASARWLASHQDPNTPVQADTVANLRLESFTNMNVSNPAVFPLTIERNSYVYLTANNVIRKIGFYDYLNMVLSYTYPVDFLQDHKALIYTNGESQVYR